MHIPVAFRGGLSSLPNFLEVVREVQLPVIAARIERFIADSRPLIRSVAGKHNVQRAGLEMALGMHGKDYQLSIETGWALYVLDEAFDNSFLATPKGPTWTYQNQQVLDYISGAYRTAEYWDEGDRPENVSPTQWRRRGERWEKIGTKGRSLSHSVVDLSTDESRRRALDGLAEWMEGLYASRRHALAVDRSRQQGFWPSTTNAELLDHCPQCFIETHPGYSVCWRCGTDVRARPLYRRLPDGRLQMVDEDAD